MTDDYKENVTKVTCLPKLQYFPGFSARVNRDWRPRLATREYNEPESDSPA